MIDQKNAALTGRELMYPVAQTWRASSLVWGSFAGTGERVELRSSVDGSLVQRAYLLDQHELERLLRTAGPVALDRGELWSFAKRLHTALVALSPSLLEALQLETGFIRRDCEELLDGSLTYVRQSRQVWESVKHDSAPPLSYRAAGQARAIRTVRCAWGTVAVILPQNAFLLVAVTTLLNALATGNSVILRAPQQSARSAALLATALHAAQAPSQAVSVVLVKAREFVEEICRTHAPVLLHYRARHKYLILVCLSKGTLQYGNISSLCRGQYMGSSQHAPQLLAQAFQGGKPVLVDGAGNCWVWVDAAVAPEHAAEILTAGALRYNGQTCTSINGAIIHPSIYDEVRARLAQCWAQLRVGNPMAADVDVGPLFDEAQAAWCEEQINSSGGRILCGGERAGNALTPTLVEQPRPDSALVREGLFGSALWLMPGELDDFISLWRFNRYPLCAGVLARSADAEWWSAQLPNAARIVLNGDPSVEYTFEPWGGYPCSGANPVSVWHEKYQRVVSVDAPMPEAEW